jgi:hypothetical protein
MAMTLMGLSGRTLKADEEAIAEIVNRLEGHDMVSKVQEDIQDFLREAMLTEESYLYTVGRLLALQTAVTANIVGITEATRLRKAISPEGFEEVDADVNSGELHFSKETEWGKWNIPLPTACSQSVGAAGLECVVPSPYVR